MISHGEHVVENTERAESRGVWGGGRRHGCSGLHSKIFALYVSCSTVQ
jgi:hypothetical protein